MTLRLPVGVEPDLLADHAWLFDQANDEAPHALFKVCSPVVAGVGALRVVVPPAAASVEVPRRAVLSTAVGVGNQAPAARTEGVAVEFPRTVPGARRCNVGLHPLSGGVYPRARYPGPGDGRGDPLAARPLRAPDPLLVGRASLGEAVVLPDAVRRIWVEPSEHGGGEETLVGKGLELLVGVACRGRSRLCP
jgi:hypothetical protein